MRAKIIIFLSIAISLISGIFYFYFETYHGRTSQTREIVFEVKEGERVALIANNLKKENLIAGKTFFFFYLKWQGISGKIIPGKYRLNGQMAIPEIALRLTKKEEVIPKEIVLTFPEGWNLEKITQRIQKSDLQNTADFSDLAKNPTYFKEKYSYEFLNGLLPKATLEGFLFPDTYFFAPESTSEKIIKKMLDNFDQKLSPELRKELILQKKTLYEIITLASILEMEVKTQADREIVSGIFWNRIKVGQPLQSCATLAYVLGVNKKQYTHKDTQTVSPYNTYLNPGLPPGPIGNPGSA
ncbi:endolytic transglycosylase MltG, partial [Patescibacteria group bacterium]|nr:endolytic transglycosylase MltG [Patescibacteria group bacterium]